jgi:hypothetical protein
MSTTVTYGETVSGIGAKDITITTATGKTVTTTVTTKTAIKIKESLPDNVPGSDLTPREKLAGGRTGGFMGRGDIWGAVTYAGGAPSAGFWYNGRPNRARINVFPVFIDFSFARKVDSESRLEIRGQTRTAIFKKLAEDRRRLGCYQRFKQELFLILFCLVRFSSVAALIFFDLGQRSLK